MYVIPGISGKSLKIKDIFKKGFKKTRNVENNIPYYGIYPFGKELNNLP